MPKRYTMRAYGRPAREKMDFFLSRKRKKNWAAQGKQMTERLPKRQGWSPPSPPSKYMAALIGLDALEVRDFSTWNVPFCFKSTFSFKRKPA